MVRRKGIPRRRIGRTTLYIGRGRSPFMGGPFRRTGTYHRINRRRVLRRPRSGGIQKIVSKRYRVTNNPFGDKVQYKFKFSLGGTLTAPGGTSFFQAQTSLRAMDLAHAQTVFTSCPGFLDYGRLFSRYRVTGIKVRFTPVWNDVAAGGTGIVPCAYMEAHGPNDVPNPSISVMPERRWGRWKPLNNWENGGGTKGISMYYSIPKVVGPDRIVINDAAYTGTITTAEPPVYVTPTNGGDMSVRMGIMSAGGDNIPAGTYGSYILTATYYTTLWTRKNALDD